MSYYAGVGKLHIQGPFSARSNKHLDWYWDWRYLGLKLSSKYVDGSTVSQSWPLPVQPVFEGEGQHHIHGAQLERRIPEDFICSQQNNWVTSQIRMPLCSTADLVNLDLFIKAKDDQFKL